MCSKTRSSVLALSCEILFRKIHFIQPFQAINGGEKEEGETGVKIRQKGPRNESKSRQTGPSERFRVGLSGCFTSDETRKVSCVSFNRGPWSPDCQRCSVVTTITSGERRRFKQWYCLISARDDERTMGSTVASGTCFLPDVIW